MRPTQSSAAAISSGAYDHLNEPQHVAATHVIDGVEYGSSLGLGSIIARRSDYIDMLEKASPVVSAEAMARFRQVVAAAEAPVSNMSSTFQQEDRTEIYLLQMYGTQQLPTHDTTLLEEGIFSDRYIQRSYMGARTTSIVITFVKEVLTHRLARRECLKFAMRNLQHMHHVATMAMQQVEAADVAVWMSGVADWCIRTARSIEAKTDCYQDLCCAVLLEIFLVRSITDKDIRYFLDNPKISVLRKGATAVFSIGLMCSGLPASRLIHHVARLEHWSSLSSGPDLFMETHSIPRTMVAAIGKQAGLCFGRVYQWAAANRNHAYSLAQWCVMARRHQVAMRTTEVEDVQHLDCVSRCELGRSISAGHVGHMPWCRGCTVIHVPEQGDSKHLGFDTSTKKLRSMRTKESYVAISHVWGQRLFGQDTRSLGQCAISELDRLAAANNVACVWLDTLCIPSEPKARRECIDGMRSIYKDATCVAVYDRGIMTADAADPLGFAFEVAISDWNSRVWTLQEGLLNRVVVYAQERHYIRHKRVSVHPYLKHYAVYAADEIASHIGLGRINIETHNLFGLAAGRTTSHAVDYVCGLGALLSGPVARTGVDLTTAAIAMAQLMGKVDIGVLCARGPRVKVEGYRWMPLGCKDLQPVIFCGITGTVLEEGLYLESNAFPVGRLERRINPPSKSPDRHLMEGGHWHTNGTIDFLVHVDDDLEAEYDFIIGSGGAEFNVAFGFIVATNGGVCEYVGTAWADAQQGLPRCSQRVYVIS